REHPRRLRTAALSQRWDAPGRFQLGGGRRLTVIPTKSDQDPFRAGSSSPSSGTPLGLSIAFDLSPETGRHSGRGESRIPWCDATFNAWIGCLRVSTACDRCHAAALSCRYGWRDG